MGRPPSVTAIIERDKDLYVALCPELDIASQGSTVEEARSNLIEALELYFETASHEDVRERLCDEVFVTRVEVKVAYPLPTFRPGAGCLDREWSG